MAKFHGNIFNRALGSIGGQTFSVAAYRGGKIQTGRQRVAPANPNTAAQQNARRNLADTIYIATEVQNYEGFKIWDEAANKLPAFQSLCSILQGVKTVEANHYQFTDAPLTIQRGQVAAQTITEISVDSADGIYKVTTGTGPGKTSTHDVLVGFAVPSSSITPQQPNPRTNDIEMNRSNASSFYVDISNYPGGQNGIFLCLWVLNIDIVGRKRYAPITFALFNQ